MKHGLVAIALLLSAAPAFAQLAIETAPGVTRYGGHTTGVEVMPGVEFYSGAVNGSSVEVMPGVRSYHFDSMERDIAERERRIEIEGARSRAWLDQTQAERRAADRRFNDFLNNLGR